ncbi:hypothetical protein [Providencia burhodogranariea]|uniref:Uncharacterized protein n=1 Tax=Providencia burhodogranariea DSM 19968 TaxID=1141662 RepID=K8WYQ9_9GAMM|nr:hypothetical protein [Providencia burhodogranariea]EKT62522.1 hypothetical protein OOA_06933 [Providencia burhodogranariea DSM 19968]
MSNKIIINTDEWPVCVLNSFPSTMDETRLWLEEMDLLLARRAQFVLVYPSIKQSSEKPTQEKMDAMKYVRRWLKGAKSPMVEYCRAMVVTLQPDGSDKEEMERMAPLISNLYGPEVLIEIDATAAKARAAALVA